MPDGEKSAKETKVIVCPWLENGSEFGPLSTQQPAPKHKADRESVLESILQNEYTLMKAASEHKADREIVLAAVKHNGYETTLTSSEERLFTAFVWFLCFVLANLGTRHLSSQLRQIHITGENDARGLATLKEYMRRNMQGSIDIAKLFSTSAMTRSK